MVKKKKIKTEEILPSPAPVAVGNSAADWKIKIATAVTSFFINQFERAFVLIIVALIFLISYMFEQKLTFLNLFYLPVIVGGYLLGTRFSVIGAFFCVLSVAFFCILYPEKFAISYSVDDLYLYISAWGGFLILAGFVVGKLQEKLVLTVESEKALNKDLASSRQELETVNQSLKDYTVNLESMVKQRTQALEKSHASIKELKNKVEETLYNTMDPEVVNQIISGRLRNEKRDISLMFSDLVGFTSYSEGLSPELVVRDLNRYLKQMEPILNRFKGHVDKLIGDGIMCEFGAPVGHGQYRLLAVLAGLKMQEELQKNNFPWKMRIGIASGPAIVGMIGSKRQTYTAIGDVVNLASRLEGLAPPGMVLIDSETYNGVEHWINAKPVRQMVHDSSAEDEEKFAEIDRYEKKLRGIENSVERAQLLYQLGHAFISLKDHEEALLRLKEAVKLAPSVVEYKLAFAEASVQVEKNKEVKVKGLKKTVLAYEVIGVKDLLADGSLIQTHVYNKYSNCLSALDFSEDDLIGVEALDGSIGHGKIVALLVYAVCKELGVAENTARIIMNAGYVADIGKQIVPHELLNRSGPLSSEEYLEVIHHAEESVRILKRMGIESKELLNIIKHSHETLDGKGYPDGLTAAQIPAGSKIILVVDCYSALVSWRPYRESWDPIVAFDELSKGVRDGKYDARVVSALKAVIAQSDAIINKGSVTNIEAQPKTLPPVSLPSTGNIQKKVKKRLPTE